MNKIAVFGKPGSGKSTFSKKLAAATEIPLYSVDSMLYQKNGDEIDGHRYEAMHEKILSSESWILEGFAPFSALDSFYRRLDAADTLVYINLPYRISYWLVTKRLIKGGFKQPEGWPKGSSVLKGSLESYKTLQLCPKFWNEKFLRRLQRISENKKLYIIRSMPELNNFVNDQWYDSNH